MIQKSYDVLSRLVRVQVQRGLGVGGTTEETYSYDGLSRLTRSTDDNGSANAVQTCAYVYDSLGRVLEDQQNGKAVSSVWTGDGKRVACTYPGGRTISQTFDLIDSVVSGYPIEGPRGGRTAGTAPTAIKAGKRAGAQNCRRAVG